jgi:hypothetical protein
VLIAVAECREALPIRIDCNQQSSICNQQLVVGGTGLEPVTPGV